MSALAPLLQAFFIERLAQQRDASPHTIAAYRDSFRLLLTFVHQHTGTAPSRLQLEDLDAATITAFLAYLENERGNSVRTRNARLTAIHSFFHYAALKAPECAELIARVLSIPEKRYESTLINYLTDPEIDALLAAPDRSTWTGRRDHALLAGGCADRAASIGAREPALRGPQPRRRLGQMPRQRQKEQVHATQPHRQEGAARLATRTRRRSRRPAVPKPQQRAPDTQRDLAPGRQAHRHRAGTMPIPEREEHHPAHAAPYRGDATAARRTPRRSRNDRAVARARNARLHQQIRARRHGTQTTRARPHHTHQHQTRPIPRTRPAARVPRSQRPIPWTTRNLPIRCPR